MIESLKNLVKEKQRELESIIENRLGVITLPTVDVDYKLNSSRTLGLCYSTPLYNFDSVSFVHTISLNPDLLLEFKEVYIEEVFVHEYSHAIVAEFYYNKTKRVLPHGKEFKEVCAWFGIEGKARTKTFNESKTIVKKRRKKNSWTYKCSCKNHKLTTIRHNKAQKMKASYSCKLCKTKLVFIKSED